MKLSFQLYSSRNFPPVEDQIAALAALGYRNVEPYGPIYNELADFKQALEKHGVAAPSGHFDLSMLEGDLQRAIDIARTLGMQLVIAPYLAPGDRPTDRAGWIAFGQRLVPIAEGLKQAGLDFAWHNHDFEFVLLPDGSLPIDALLSASPMIGLELDVAWAVKGGVDAAAFIERNAERIIAIHMKDMARDNSVPEEQGWTDVGLGTMPWADLWPSIEKTRATIAVMEHDEPLSFKRFAENSARGVAKFGVS
jgi:sugar phosphate isomerase/epimerase